MHHFISGLWRFAQLALVLIFNITANGQGQARYWHFGTGAGLDFATSPPSLLAVSSLTTYEGTADISDAFGNLLFYTDGTTVYTASNTVMGNGTGLFGNNSSTQSAIIVKKPGSATLYYIFTIDQLAGTSGLCYSIVDMAMAAGSGSVVIKNVNVYGPSCEKLTAVKHCNGVDYWIVSHEYNSNVFRSYLLSSGGLSAGSVNSSCGAAVSNTLETIGYMKCSPQGSKLLCARYNITAAPSTVAELFDFDSSTGVVSNPVALLNASSYGCEFSSDGSKAYVGLYDKQTILQYNLCAGSNSAIIASQYSINCPGATIGALQLAPDSKIYVSLFSSSVLAAINSPNQAGATCNFALNALSIPGATTQLGFPNFIADYFKPLASTFSHTASCLTASFTSQAQVGLISDQCSVKPSTVQSVTWNFGDPSSGPANTSIGTTATHVFSSAGTYTVKLIITSNCGNDTVYKLVSVPVTAGANLSVSGAFSICSGENHTYSASGAPGYLWSNGGVFSATNLNPTVTTVYTLTGLYNNNCSANKQFTVVVNKCTGLSEYDDLANFTVYPNPFNERLIIKTQQQENLSLINQQGLVILEIQGPVGEVELDTKSVKPGFYYLKLGQTIQKVVKLPSSD